MRTFIVCCFVATLCAGAWAAELDEGRNKIMMDCIKENGVSEADFTAFSKGETKMEDIKDNMKCSFKCFMVKNGYMDEAGHVDTAAIMAKYPGHKLTEQVVENCKSITDPNPCEMAFKMTMCLIAEDAKLKSN